MLILDRGSTAGRTTNFVVRTCFAFAGGNQTLALTNDLGCAEQANLVGDFRYTNDGLAIAPLVSAFRFPHSDTMHLQCTVELCEEACRRTDCRRRRDEPLDERGGTARRRLLVLNEAPLNIASTTVRVHEALNVTGAFECAPFMQITQPSRTWRTARTSVGYWQACASSSASCSSSP